jgi:glutathione S-transferase
VPVLVLDDGTTLPESEVIVEYLEDRYPQVPLRPTDPAERARVRLIARAAELYLFPSVVDIFQARGLGPSDPQHIEKLFSALELNLLRLSGLLDDRSDSWHALGARLSLADGALAPFLQYVDVIAKASGRKLLEPHPRLERFWSGAQRDPLVSTVTQEIARALAR